MKAKHLILPLLLAAGAAVALVASSSSAMPVGNPSVPEPAKAVDINSYSGLWYEVGRYENRFEKDCEAVTAEYQLLPGGQVSVTNRCRKGSLTGPEKISSGKAKVVPDSQNAKLKVSFFGPFYFGDYWVLDHADDYSWSIVGEPSGRYLWLLSRTAQPDAALRATLEQRARALGYDWSLVRITKH